jgi:hypothetical protein
VLIVRAVKDFLSEKPDLGRGDRVNLVFYIAYHLVCELSQTPWPRAIDILNIDEASYCNKTKLENSLSVILPIYQRLTAEREDENPDTVAKGPDLLAEIEAVLKTKFGEEKREETAPKKKRKTRDVLRDSVIK